MLPVRSTSPPPTSAQTAAESHRRRWLAVPVAGLAVVAVLTGCGNDIPAPTGVAASDDAVPGGAPLDGPASPSVSPRLVVTAGITPDELVHCLRDAGLTAVRTLSAPYDVHVPVASVEVRDLGAASPSTGAEVQQRLELLVFADPLTAEEEYRAITLSHDPTETARVTGNVVVRWAVPPDQGGVDDPKAAVDECLPG